ncbi:MAG: M28 family peptidase [Gemmatimonadetes bacterium]|nr:M28 family peptidase [Gemmatimonadota bacterium]
MHRTIRAATAVAVLSLVQTAGAQGAGPDWSLLERPRTNAPKPTATAITVEDLRTRVFRFADDSMGGRMAGEPGNAKGVEHIAAELKRLGVEPAGENGTYFQNVPVVTRTINEASVVRIGDQSLEMWKDYIVRDQGFGTRAIDGVPVVFAGVWGQQGKMISRDAADGKLVVLAVTSDEAGSGTAGLPNRQQVNAYFAKAAGIAVVAMEKIPPASLAIYRQPAGGYKTSFPTPVPMYLYITDRIAGALLGGDLAAIAPGTAGRSFSGTPLFTETPSAVPMRNVMGIVRGSDPQLRNQYVAIGAHNDHVGMTNAPAAHDSVYILNHLFMEQGADSPDPELKSADIAKLNATIAEVRRKTNGKSAFVDSIYNGADDDASGSMAVLELAEYFAGQREKPKRSLLFIWHVAEELGLFGSEHFSDHPTVPRESIVAAVNMDMVGRGAASDVTGASKDGKLLRGNENYVQLVGSRRVSTEYGDLVERINKDMKLGMLFDYALDADAHPQNIYCRSDHWNYARYSIPTVFFTTGGHADYHQLTDEPQYIDYAKMQKVTNLAKELAVAAANANRVKIDKPNADPRGPCRQ